MEYLRLRSNLNQPLNGNLPFAVYTVGTEDQRPMTRLEGFSANQLFLTFTGHGRFRQLGEEVNKWQTILPGTLLYIPAGLPHEYAPQGEEPWRIGFVTFVEQASGPLHSWGFGQSLFKTAVSDTSSLYEMLQAIWSRSGPQYDAWGAAEQLLAFCLQVKKQMAQSVSLTENASNPAAIRGARYRDSVVSNATRFMQDHLQRHITMSELSAHVGYSPKQLTRIFHEALGTTPLHYLQRIRLQTAAHLLEHSPDMTVRQAAAHIGMEPIYFTRLFRRMFAVTPSQFRDGFRS